MRKQFKLLSLMVLALALNRSLHAQGTAFTYQGLLNTNGVPANGLYDIQFGAYDDPAAGNLLGGLVTNPGVSVSNGLFTTTLDFGSGVFNGTPLWLDIAVSSNGAGDFSAVTPRQALTPTPYSIFSSESGIADTALAVDSSVVSATSLNTTGDPSPGQVLGYNGSQLVWQDPVVGSSTGGWSLTGNLGTLPGLNFLGTLDSEPLELKVGGARALRLEPDLTSSGAPNVIGGSSANSVSSGIIGATVSGGGAADLSGTAYPNTVTSSFASIGGGANNNAGGQYSRVGGGYQNSASGYISAVVGGAYNNATSNEAAVLGGAYNVASGIGATVGGGGYDGTTASGNGASGQVSFVGGGLGNGASGYASAISGGYGNGASGPEAVVGGGNGNVASGSDSAVYVNGQFFNFVIGDSTVGGGDANAATASGATVPGGAFNIASGDFSLAAGFRANAAHAGSFVWSDDSASSTFSTSKANQFLIRAAGGVGIGTSQTPPGGLRVDSGGLAVTGASSPNYGTAAGVFVEKAGSAGAVFAFNYASSTPESLALNSPGGNVGIGTVSPAYTLDVNGTTRTHSIIITGGADLAEPFKMGGKEMTKGSVVVIDKEHPGELALSSREYDSCVAGIVSGANGINPGIALHQQGALDGDQNVALSGRVYVLADASKGAIEPGDLLTTSSTPGHAMKVTNHSRAQGAIIGKAMTSLEKGKGMVLVLVTLQ